jgi:alpha-L-rhamnosidase
MTYYFDNQGRQSRFKATAGEQSAKFKSSFLDQARQCNVNLQQRHLSISRGSFIHQKRTELLDHPEQWPAMGRGNSLILDLGCHQVGYFKCDFDTVGSYPDAPALVKLRFCESKVELDASDNYTGWLPAGWMQEEVMRLDQFPTQKIFKRRYACRYIKISVLDTSQKYQLQIKAPIFTAQSSAGTLSAVSPIQTDDSQLITIDDTALATLHDCMQLVFEDGPKRDRRLWLGDFRFQALTNSITFRNEALIKRCLYLFASGATQSGSLPADIFATDNGRFIPDDLVMGDYSLLYVDILENYFRMTRDVQTLADLYPVAKQAVMARITHLDDRYRIDRQFVQTAFLDWYRDSTIVKDSAVTGVLLFALKQLIKLAGRMNDADIKQLQVVADQLSQFAATNLFDPETNLFVSGEKRQLNWFSQIWLVRAGVFEPQKNRKILESALNQLSLSVFVTPYAYSELCLALCENGLMNRAVKLIKRYWGSMIKQGIDTFEEVFDLNELDYSPYGVNSKLLISYCHGWGCMPAYLLRKYL